MAKGRIQGITIELNGETKGLNNALKGVNQQSSKLTTELRDVEKLLKFNPGNVEALAQKQQLLTKQIEATTQKLGQLKQAESQVEAQFNAGEIGEEQYRAFKREIEYTEGALNGYKGQLSKVQAEQENLAQNTKRINTLFEATGSNVDDYADVLGGRLTTAIKAGTATSEQLEQAINKIGRAALGTDVDIGKMKNALDTIDDGAGIQNVESDLRGLFTQSDKTADALEAMGDKLDTGNLMEASEQASAVSDKLLDFGENALEAATDLESAAGRYNKSFALTGKEAAETKDKITDLYNTGLVDSYEEASEMMIQTRNQLRGLNGESLDDVTKKAVAFSKTFDSDMTESLRGANALMTTYGMSAEESFDLMTVGAQHGLNKTDELGDNLAEYATLFEENGYSAKEMFEILDSGLKGGAYNLDKVNDLIKEFGIRIADGSIEKAVSEMGGSFEKNFQKMKKSGASNKDIFKALVGEVSKLKTEQEKAAAISAIFGSMGEDAGVKVMEAMGGVSKSVKGVKGSYDDVKGSAAELTKANDTQKLAQAWNELKSALIPIGTDILKALMPLVDIVKMIAEAFSALPAPLRTVLLALGALVVVVGTLLPVFMALQAAALAAEVSIAGLVAAALPIVAIVAAIVVAIVALVAGFKYLWDNVEGFRQFWINVWNSIVGVFSTMWAAIKPGLDAIANELQKFWKEYGPTIIAALNAIWKKIASFISWLQPVWSVFWKVIGTVLKATWNVIVTVIKAAIGVISGIIDVFAGLFTGDWERMGKGVRKIWTSLWNAVKSLIKIGVDYVVGQLNNLGEFFFSIIGGIVNWVKGKFKSIQEFMTDPIGKAKDKIKSILDGIKAFFKGLNLKFPKIKMPKLPHFSLKGKFSLKDMTVPKLSVDWFAKGGILTKPTAFGMNGSSVMAGGEAGKEAVLPLNSKNLGAIGQMIAETMPQSGDNYEFTFNVNGNIDKQMIALLKKEMQKVLVEQTRRKDSSLGGVTL
ncbi:phage tail tape measure protein [Listeria goaensis]|uniref:phage tail tape measure protein n=1 Tax=Listeria goaensis TaxID=1649188 RepID=UPI000B594B11|nr:phage tail tape measure protein [Listeria goaensis]